MWSDFVSILYDPHDQIRKMQTRRLANYDFKRLIDFYFHEIFWWLGTQIWKD